MHDDEHHHDRSEDGKADLESETGSVAGRLGPNLTRQLAPLLLLAPPVAR